MTTKTMYQMHIRSWETMIYLPCIYVMADSVDDAFAQMEPFRSLYQAKSACAEGDWIDDGTVHDSNASQADDDRFADPVFSPTDIRDFAPNRFDENIEFEDAEDSIFAPKDY